MKRLYKPGEFKRLISDLISSTGDTRRLPKEKRISRQFVERIMMAVTEVNGCRYCSYFHTRVALQSGMEKSDIQNILSGCFDDAPEEEIPALYFAQYYAESGARPDPEAVTCLAENYGEETAREIIAYTRAIMVGNAWGNMFDSLLYRIRGKSNREVTFADEIGVMFGPFIMIPALFTRKLFSRGKKLFNQTEP